MVLSSSFWLIVGVISSATFTFVNKCDQTVWPGILSNAGIAPLSLQVSLFKKGNRRYSTRRRLGVVGFGDEHTVPKIQTVNSPAAPEIADLEN